MATIAGSHETSRANPDAEGDSQPRYLLRADLEVFEAPNGDVYLLGPDEDHLLAQPGPDERALLRKLGQHAMGRSEMVGVLAAEGNESQATDAIEALLASGLLSDYHQPTAAPLAPEMAERYDRQLAYFTQTHPGAEHHQQQLLAHTTIVIVGVGGLGSWAGAALACLGVGKLVLIDDDRVELSNLNRQVLFRPQDLGALKVDVVAAALRSFNPELEVDANAERIGGPRDLARFLPDAAIVIATADWPPYQVNRWINEACVRARVPHLSAGQVPPYIRVGPMVIPGATGCVECDERAARARFVFYDDVAAQREQAATLAPTLGPASAMAGSMIGMEVLHYITQISRPMTAGKAITLDMRSWQTATREITRDEGCPMCGDL